MHPTTTALALCIALVAGAAHAAGDKPSTEPKAAEPKAAQQSRMKACNADAKAQGLKGGDRRKFMGECLKKR